MSRGGATPTRYRFVELASGLDEIWCGEARAFLLAPPDATPVIAEGRCPHRGGPLALGSYDCRDRQWRCPWHGQKHALAALQARALPAIRRGPHWLVAIEAAASMDEAICLSRRRQPLA
jgi:nitrite reductase/ring-hydroxylating ferredoxin subunit